MLQLWRFLVPRFNLTFLVDTLLSAVLIFLALMKLLFVHLVDSFTLCPDGVWLHPSYSSLLTRLIVGVSRSSVTVGRT